MFLGFLLVNEMIEYHWVYTDKRTLSLYYESYYMYRIWVLKGFVNLAGFRIFQI